MSIALLIELRDDPLDRGYAAMTDQQAADSLNAVDRVVLRSTFGSYRTLCGILSAVEYATLKAAVSTVGHADQRVADMEQMLLIPGDGSGQGGGIDFGHPAVRGVIDAMAAATLITADLAVKLKTLGEHLSSRAEEIGITTPVYSGQVAEARRALQ